MTMQAEHTPGPWHVEFYESEPDSPFVCADGEPSDPVINEFSDIGGRQWANANLSAAAPDLLKAVRRFVDGIEHKPTCAVSYCPKNPESRTTNQPCPWCEARAAIAKATGGAS